MTPRDVALLALMALTDNTEMFVPKHGFQAAAERLRRRRLVVRDPTRTIKPYCYTLTEAGYKMVSEMVGLLRRGL